MRTDSRKLWLGCAALSLALPSLAQVPETADAPEPAVGPGPVAFEPAAGADDDVIEEIIVRGRRDEWRLPDLGDELRREREELEKPRPGQVEFEFIPLYDPAEATREPDLFRMDDPLQRVGKIELFRFRFGSD